MKASFKINRFNKLVAKEFKESLPIVLKMAMILSIVLIGTWLVSMLTSGSVSADARYGIIKTGMYISMFLFPFVIYKYVNGKKAGVDYAMLPVSGEEKFLSMIIVSSLISPIVILITSIFTDVVLASVSSQIFTGQITGTNNFFANLPSDLLDMLLLQTYAIFGNLFFLHNKAIKTLLWMLVINIAIGMLVLISIKYMFDVPAFENNSFSLGVGQSVTINGNKYIQGMSPAFDNIMTFIKILMFIIMLLALVVGSYFRLKTQKY